MTDNDEPTRAIALIQKLSATSDESGQILVGIKNYLIGHELHKQLYVEHGLIPPVVDIFERHEDVATRQEAGVVLGTLIYGDPQFLTKLVEAGAISILLSAIDPFTNGPDLLLQSLRLLNRILEVCTSYMRSPTCAQGPIASSKIVQTLYRKPRYIRHIHNILRQQTSTATIAKQITEVSKLITQTVEFADFAGDNSNWPRLPSEASRKRILVEQGVLDVLVYRMGSFILRDTRDHRDRLTGFLKPEDPRTRAKRQQEQMESAGEATGFVDNVLETTPEPATSLASLAPVLNAILAITRDSVEHSRRMHQAAWLSGIAPNYPRTLVSNDSKGKTSEKIDQFPPLATAALLAQHHRRFPRPPSSTGSSAFQTPQAHTPFPRESQTIDGEDQNRLSEFENGYIRALLVTPQRNDSLTTGKYTGSVLLPWLIARARFGDSLTRLAAIGLVTNLARVGMTTKKTPYILKALVLPILLQLLDGGVGFEGGPTNSTLRSGVDVVSRGIDRKTATEWQILENAPKILAAMVMDDSELQQSAVEHQAIKKLTDLVQRALKSETMSHSADKNVPLAAGLVTSTLLYNDHKMKMAEAAMRGLAALAATQDDIRAQVIKTGVLQSVVTALRPLDPTMPVSTQPDARVQHKAEDLYPAQVIIAAVGLVRALSRSINLLRTTLMDAHVGAPLFSLLTHPNIDVRIAATTVVCNLVLDFSPMKTQMVEAGVVDILCRHVRSSNPFMRINAMWALKHVVYVAKFDERTKCYHTLGHDWLYQLAANGVFHDPSRSSRFFPQRDSDGDEGMAEEFDDASDDDILIEEETFESVEMEEQEDEDAHRLRTSLTPEELIARGVPYCYDFPRNTHPDASVKHSVYKKPSKAGREFIQQQATGFFRNLFSGEGMEPLVEMVLQDMGRQKFLSLLADKLIPRVEKPRSEGLGYIRSTPNPASTPTPPISNSSFAPTNLYNDRINDDKWRICFDSSPETVEAVVYTVVHIAAQSKKLRDMLSQHAGHLLKLVTNMAHNPNANIRRGVVWLVFNIIGGPDEAGNDTTRKDRCRKLDELGFSQALEFLLADTDQDIRERTRLALHELRKEGGFSTQDH